MTLVWLAIVALAVAMVALAVRGERHDRRQDRTMDKLADAIADLNEATNLEAAEHDRIAAELADLKARGVPPTDAQIDAIRASAARLRLLAADPANPVPAPPPPEPPAPVTP